MKARVYFIIYIINIYIGRVGYARVGNAVGKRVAFLLYGLDRVQGRGRIFGCRYLIQ